MKFALAAVSIVGITIGLALAEPGSAPAPVAPVASGAPVASAAPVAAPPPKEDVPVETVLDRTPNGHFLAIADVNDEPIRFVVDTGADTVALTEADATRAHIAFDPAQYQVVGRGAAGDVRGQEVRIASIVLDGKRASDVRAVVLQGADMSLLGHSYLRRMRNVQITGDQMRLR